MAAQSSAKIRKRKCELLYDGLQTFTHCGSKQHVLNELWADVRIRRDPASSGWHVRLFRTRVGAATDYVIDSAVVPSAADLPLGAIPRSAVCMRPRIA
jgi:hypothetical protein